MNNVPGAIVVLCGILWHLAIPLVPVCLMAWDAFVNNNYPAASINTAAWFVFYYTLICPHSTLVSKPKVWAYCRRILSFLNSLLLASILGFVVSQFLVSIAVNSITAHPICIDDAQLFGPDIPFEANITEVAVAVNVTESEPIITVPVHTIPDFITVFGSPTQAVPTPVPVAKSTWTPAASSTVVPKPEPTPSKAPQSEPEPEREPTLEPEEWIKPDEVFPVFQHMVNEYISRAKAVKACWHDLPTDIQYIVVAIAGAIVWALLPVLVQFAAASTLTAVASYTSSLLFPILQEQGYTRDQSLMLCMALAVDITAIAASTLRILTQRAQTSRINATVDTSRPQNQRQPIHTGQPVSNSTDQQIIYFPRPEQPEVDEHVRMYVEGLVKQHTAKLLQDAQLHGMITNAVLLAMQGPQAMPMQAAAWQSINQHMWLPLVQLVHDKVTACFREQQEQAHDDNPNPSGAPSEGSSTGQRARSGYLDDDHSLEAYLGTRDDDDDDDASLLPDDATEAVSGTGGAGGSLLLENNAPGASSGEGDVDPLADSATVASSQEGAQGLDLDGDNDHDNSDTNSDNGSAPRPLADLDYLGEDGRILGEHLCRMFARLLNGDYPPTKKTRRGLKPSQKRARDAAKAGEEAQGQEVDVQSQDGEQPQQQASPEQDAPSEQDVQPEQESSLEPEEHDESHNDDQSEQQASPEQEGAHSPPSTGDDVNDNNHVVEPEPADPAPASENECGDTSSDEKCGDNKDTPIPTTPTNKDLIAFLDNQERPSSSGDNHTNIDDGKVPTNPTVDNQDGDNKDTPIPNTPIKKGLASSRFAPNSQERPSSSGDQEAPSSSGGDNTNVHIDGGESHNNSTADNQGGDNNDTPVPTTPTEKGLASSRFGDDNHEQPSTSGSDDGKVHNTPTAEHQSGDNKDTPLATPPVKKTGLAGSRFADVSYTPRAIPQVKEDSWASRFGKKEPQPPTSGSDGTSINRNRTGDSQGTDRGATPIPTPPVKKGLFASRFADDSYTPRSIAPVKDDTWAARFSNEKRQPPTTGGNDSGNNQTRSSSNGGGVPSTSTNGGQKGDNKDTPVPASPAKKGLGTSRWASDEASINGSTRGSNAAVGNNAPNNNAGAMKTGGKPVVGMGKSRWASDQPPTSGSFTGAYAGSQPRYGTPTAPTAPRRNPGLGGSQHNTGRPPLSSTANRRLPSPHGGNDQAAGDNYRAPTPSSTNNPQELRQDLSSTERIVATSKYWHECLPDHRIVGKPDGKINAWYRTGNNLIDRGNAMIERGEKEGPKKEHLVPPFKFPQDPEAAYRDPQPKPTTSSFDFPRPDHPVYDDTADNATPSPSIDGSPTQQPSQAPSKARPICPPGLHQDLSSIERLRQTSKFWHKCLPAPELVDQPDGKINQYYRTEDHRRLKYRGGLPPCIQPHKFPGDEYAAYRVPQPVPTSSPRDFPIFNHRPSAAAAGNGNSTPSGTNKKRSQNKNGGNKA